jgi:hypothetical protein
MANALLGITETTRKAKQANAWAVRNLRRIGMDLKFAHTALAP